MKVTWLKRIDVHTISQSILYLENIHDKILVKIYVFLIIIRIFYNIYKS